IFSLFKARAGSLWVGTDQTLDRFDPDTESFVHYSLRVPELDVTDVIVFHIDQDRDGQIWLATGSGLFSLNPSTGKTTLFQHDPADALSLSDNYVGSTLEDRSGRFWVATRAGLREVERHTGKVMGHITIHQSA